MWSKSLDMASTRVVGPLCSIQVFPGDWGDGETPPPLPGSSPSRIQGYPQDEGLGDKDSKAESRA